MFQFLDIIQTGCNRLLPRSFRHRMTTLTLVGIMTLLLSSAVSAELKAASTDRSEVNDLIKAHPDRAAKMAALYNTWSKRTGAISHKVTHKLEPSTQPR